MLLASVYFLQGMGGFASYTQKFYLIDDWASTCPCMLTEEGCQEDTPSGYPEDKSGYIACHEGLHLPPGSRGGDQLGQTDVRVFGNLPWNYKIYCACRHSRLPPVVCGSNLPASLFILMSARVSAVCCPCLRRHPVGLPANRWVAPSILDLYCGLRWNHRLCRPWPHRRRWGSRHGQILHLSNQPFHCVLRRVHRRLDGSIR